MPESKIACVSCGDINILYPALAAHLSIKRYNTDFDHFSYIVGEDISLKYIDYTKQYGIKHVYASYDIINKLNKFKSFARYSKFLFLRYLIPDYFYSLGYEYLIDIDHDIFCLEQYDLDSILPTDTIISYRPVNSVANILSHTDNKFLKATLNLSEDESFDKFYPHGGFTIINLRKYYENKIADLYMDIYNKVEPMNFKACPLNELIMALIHIMRCIDPKLIDRSYNTSMVYPGHPENPKNIHFALHIKPWNIVSYINQNHIKINPEFNYISYLLHIQKYLSYVETLDFKDNIIESANYQNVINKSILNLENQYKNKIKQKELAASPDSFTKQYFMTFETFSRISSSELIPVLLSLFPDIKSVIDIGCGTGNFLYEFSKKNIEVFGIDFSPTLLEIAKIDNIKIHNLIIPLSFKHKFDLALCLDVAQLIAPEAADTLIFSLTQSADIVVFCAAIQGQRGKYHINEQYPQYWRDKFLNFGFIDMDILRPIIWENKNIAWWYKQNILLFVNSQNNAIINKLATMPSLHCNSLIHPDMIRNRF